MSGKAATQPSALIEPEVVRETLERVLASRYFVNAHKKKAFLQLICDLYVAGRAAEINEYRLAFDVFKRDDKYNPSTDPIVRVVAHEIRKKLELYYTNEGASDDVHLELPAGSYQPIFTRRVVDPVDDTEEAAHGPQEAVAVVAVDTPEPRPEPIVEAGPHPDHRRFAPAMAALVGLALVLAFAVAVLALSNRELRQRVFGPDDSKSALMHGPLWSTFARSSTPPLVILSNPPILRLANASDPPSALEDSIPLAPENVEAMKGRFVTNPEVMVREPGGSGTDPNGGEHPPVLKQSGPPRLIYSKNVYTGMGEAIGLHYLTDFFRSADRTIHLKQSRTLSAEDLKNHNVIMLGGIWVNEWSGKLTSLEDFVFTGNGTVQNRNPQSGEAPEYVPQFDGPTGNLVVDYALITVKPNVSGGNKVMVLAGVYSQGTEAAAECVTNADLLGQLTQRLLQVGGPSGPPEYFQALLKVDVENGIPTTVAILAVHPIDRPRS